MGSIKNYKSIMIIFFVVYVFLTLFSDFLDLLLFAGKFSLFSYLDELFMIFYLIGHWKRDKISSFLIKLGAVSLLFILLTLFSEYRPSIYKILVGCYIQLKLFFIFYLFYKILYKEHKYSEILYRSVNITMIIGILLNLILGSTFNTLFNQRIVYKFDGLVLNGFATQPNQIGMYLAFIYLYFLFRKGIPSFNKLLSYSFLLSAVILLFIGTRSTLVIVLAAFGYYFVVSKNFLKITIPIVVVVMIGMVVTFKASLIEKTIYNYELMSSINTLSKSGYQRGIVIHYGREIAKNFFPLGTGLSTYATKMSYGSKVYDDFVSFGKPIFTGERDGLFDSNLASILGELGYLGLLLIIYLCFMIRKLLIQQSPNLNHLINIFIITLLIFSITKSTFVNSYSSIFFSFLLIRELNVNVFNNKNIISDEKNINN